jgi:hypothetical protein
MPLVKGIYDISVKKPKYKKRVVYEQPSIPQSSSVEQEKVKRERKRKKGTICVGVFIIIIAIVLGSLFPSLPMEFVSISNGIIGIILIVKGIYDISVEKSRYKKRMMYKQPSIPQSSPVEQSSTKENIQKILCSSCGVENLKSNTYCESCGQSLSPS